MYFSHQMQILIVIDALRLDRPITQDNKIKPDSGCKTNSRVNKSSKNLLQDFEADHCNIVDFGLFNPLILNMRVQYL